MKILKTIVLVASLLLNIFLIYRFFIAGNTVPNSKDARTAISVSENNREIVMKEMRTFLEAVQHIQNGLIQNDFKQIETHAATSGRSVEQHVPGELIRSLPLSFKKLGFDTHDRFDKIARLAREKKKEEITNELNGLLANCTSCHASFKIVTH